MKTFTIKQVVADICGVKVGGQMGENPTCIIPSIFYDKHKIVADSKKGDFDRQQAEALINQAQVLSDRTGNPLFIDIMGLTVEALSKYVSFVAEHTSVPFLVDSVSRDAKLEALKQIHSVGLTSRVIYNSINYLTTAQELEALRDWGVESAVVLAFDPKKPFGGRESGLPNLLKSAETAEINNILVDTAVLEVTSMSAAANSIWAVKERFGLPSGCAPANAISMWRRLKTGEFGAEARRVCLGASALYMQIMGANFVISGPIEYADAAFSACAMADSIIAAEAQSQGAKISPSHPIFRIF